MTFACVFDGNIVSKKNTNRRKIYLRDAIYPSYDYCVLGAIFVCKKYLFNCLPWLMIKKKSSSQKISQFFQKFGQKSKLRQIRFIIMCGVAVIAYVLTVAKLFFREQLLSSMVPLLIFFIFFHFAFLELRHRGLKRII